MTAILEGKNRTAAGPTVPPGGLYMTKLWYDEDVRNPAARAHNMEELKPVPRRRRKNRTFCPPAGLSGHIALLLGAVAAVVYRDRLNFDSIRRWFVYSLEKSVLGQTESFQYDSAGKGGYSQVGDDLLVWSTAGVRLYLRRR